MTQCKHGSPDVSGNFNHCSLGRYGGKPSDGVCRQCPDYSGPSRGLGDTIDKITSATGIKAVVKAVAGEGCGCAQRRVSLNQLFPSQ
jgi:hypothetical protein